MQLVAAATYLKR